MRVIGKADVERLFTMDEAIPVADSTFRKIGTPNVTQPLRTVVRIAEQAAVFGAMPAHVQDGNSAGFGIKAVVADPSNAGRGLPTHLGVVVTFDDSTGHPRAVIDAESLTAIRTAAASAVATRVLANCDAGNVAILGSGTQARLHLHALRSVRPVRQVWVWSRNRQHAEQLAEWSNSIFDFDTIVAGSASQAVAQADLVCTVTSSPTPLICAPDIQPGTHINAVGACFPMSRELSSDLVAAARTIVDISDSAMAEAGDLLIPAAEGVLMLPQSFPELGEVLRREQAGRTRRQEITVFESLGFGALDVASAIRIFELAVDAQAGIEVDLS